jgi:alkyl hydroperoxide reductase subunit AhpC
MENTSIMPRIGDKAPDFEAITTTGAMKFSEYNKGQYDRHIDYYSILTAYNLTKLRKISSLKKS